MKDFSEKMRLAAEIIENKLDFEFKVSKKWQKFNDPIELGRMKMLIYFIQYSIEFRIHENLHLGGPK